MKQKQLAILGMISILLFPGRPTGAAEPSLSVPTLRVPRLSGIVRIDGNLDEPMWRKARRHKLVDNQNGKKPVQPTVVSVFHNDGILYVGFSCKSKLVTAGMTRRDDDLWREEAVEVFLDPGGAGKEYLEVEVNPLGTVYDAWIRFSSTLDFEEAKSFHLTQLAAAAQIRRIRLDPQLDRGWTCEIAIPLVNLPVPISPAARINLTRIDRVNKKHVYQAWSPTWKWFHVPSRFGRVEFE